MSAKGALNPCIKGIKALFRTSENKHWLISNLIFTKFFYFSFFFKFNILNFSFSQIIYSIWSMRHVKPRMIILGKKYPEKTSCEFRFCITFWIFLMSWLYIYVSLRLHCLSFSIKTFPFVLFCRICYYLFPFVLLHASEILFFFKTKFWIFKSLVAFHECNGLTKILSLIYFVLILL